MSKKRVNFYIDGFNLYHSLKELIENGNHTENYLKWFSMKGICQSILHDDECLHELFYFSSPPIHKSEPVQTRHQKFMQATLGTGVKVITGKFRKRHEVECKSCGKTWPRHDEKETDVNLATKVIVDAFEGRFDKCFIVSNDTDMKAVAEIITNKFQNLEYVCVAPINTAKRTPYISRAFNLKHRTITKEHIKSNILPEMTPDSKGGFVKRPKEYEPNQLQEALLKRREQ